MPKTKEQFEQMKRERVEKIYSAALYLFSLNSFSAVTSDEITKEVGCSHGLLYHYFSSKEELFSSLVSNVALKLDEEIKSSVDFSLGPKELIKSLLDAYLNALRSPRDDYACAIQLLLNLYISYRSMNNPKGEFKFTMFEDFYSTIEKGQKEGVFKEDATLDLTVSLMAILKGLSYNRINLGYNKCTIPNSGILMRLLLK